MTHLVVVGHGSLEVVPLTEAVADAARPWYTLVRPGSNGSSVCASVRQLVLADDPTRNWVPTAPRPVESVTATGKAEVHLMRFCGVDD